MTRPPVVGADLSEAMQGYIESAYRDFEKQYLVEYGGEESPEVRLRAVRQFREFLVHGTPPMKGQIPR